MAVREPVDPRRGGEHLRRHRAASGGHSGPGMTWCPGADGAEAVISPWAPADAARRRSFIIGSIVPGRMAPAQRCRGAVTLPRREPIRWRGFFMTGWCR